MLALFVTRMGQWLTTNSYLYADYLNSNSGGYQGQLSQGQYPRSGSRLYPRFSLTSILFLVRLGFPSAPSMLSLQKGLQRARRDGLGES
jgi:hypothetical protein